MPPVGDTYRYSCLSSVLAPPPPSLSFAWQLPASGATKPVLAAPSPAAAAGPLSPRAQTELSSQLAPRMPNRAPPPPTLSPLPRPARPALASRSPSAGDDARRGAAALKQPGGWRAAAGGAGPDLRPLWWWWGSSGKTRGKAGAR